MVICSFGISGDIYRHSCDEILHCELIILTKSISRFGRNTEDTLTALRTIKTTGARIVFNEASIDTGVEDSELMISLLSAYAPAENESRRQNQLWGIRKRLQDGSSALYRWPCYGFRKKVYDELVIETHEAGIVQNIYQMYLDGASIVSSCTQKHAPT